MKYCANCGAEMLDSDVFCPKCGNPVNKQVVETTTEKNGTAVAAFVFSFLIAIVGLILGVVALNKAKNLNGKGKGFAVAAIIISIINMLLALRLQLA